MTEIQRAANVEGNFLVPLKQTRELRNCRLDRGRCLLSQVQCHAHIPGRDRALLALCERLTSRLEVNSFGDRLLNCVNPGMSIRSSMKCRLLSGRPVGRHIFVLKSSHLRPV
jgi:hypothetical protein